MPESNSHSAGTKVLVVDDNDGFVKALVKRLARNGIQAEGVSEPSKVLAWTRAQKFGEFDIIFLDMRLGFTKVGRPLSAADLLLHVMTYCPTARAVVFTQEDVSVEECTRCIQFGALGFIPKMSTIDHFVLVANVYRKLADKSQTYEERIRALWAELSKQVNPAKGRHLEMLATNLFNSISGFRVISNNALGFAGESDLVIENLSKHRFWKTIKSYHILIECKNLKTTAEINVLHILARKVTKKAACKVGILISWSGVSSGFRTLQAAESDVTIFTLDRNDLLELIRRKPEDREPYLRGAFERQL
jgi:ActR/RegA family two-component response regulator